MASRPIDRILNVLVSAAAVPVLYGALQKILHSPNADLWLKIGLYTECAIFAAYALLYLIAPPKEADLSNLEKIALPTASGNPSLDKMNQMMADANITPATFSSLGEGFKKLGASVDGIKDVSNVVSSTSEFATKTKEATSAIASMKDAFVGASNTMQSFSGASEETKKFHEQVQVMTKNLGSLNAIYELELQDTNNHLKTMNNFYSNLAQASEAMKGSVADAQKSQEQLGLLAKNLGSLNNVYGNMLSAMQGR